ERRISHPWAGRCCRVQRRPEHHRGAPARHEPHPEVRQVGQRRATHRERWLILVKSGPPPGPATSLKVESTDPPVDLLKMESTGRSGPADLLKIKSTDPEPGSGQEPARMRTGRDGRVQKAVAERVVKVER